MLRKSIKRIQKKSTHTNTVDLASLPPPEGVLGYEVGMPVNGDFYGSVTQIHTNGVRGTHSCSNSPILGGSNHSSPRRRKKTKPVSVNFKEPTTPPLPPPPPPSAFVPGGEAYRNGDGPSSFCSHPKGAFASEAGNGSATGNGNGVVLRQKNKTGSAAVISEKPKANFIIYEHREL